jgi:hypothetical protein
LGAFESPVWTPGKASQRPRYWSWAALKHRTFEADELACSGLMDERRTLQARAQHGVLRAGSDQLDRGTGGFIRLLGLLGPLGLAMESAEGKVGLPEFGRVTHRLSQRESSLEPALCLFVLAVGEVDLPEKSPAFDLVFPGPRAAGNLKAVFGELPRFGCVSARQPVRPAGGSRQRDSCP